METHCPHIPLTPYQQQENTAKDKFRVIAKNSSDITLIQNAQRLNYICTPDGNYHSEDVWERDIVDEELANRGYEKKWVQEYQYVKPNN